MTTRLVAVTSLLCFGTLSCVRDYRADLSKVHTPDLQEVHREPGGRVPGTKGTKHPIPPADQWRVYSSLEPYSALQDGLPETLAVAAVPSREDQYILIDLRKLCTVRSVTQLHPLGGAPTRYRIDVAGTHNHPYVLQYVGPGGTGGGEQSIAQLPEPTPCRFLRITMLDGPPSDQPWSVSELRVE